MNVMSQTELTCSICGRPRHPRAQLCKRCKKLSDRLDTRRKADKKARVRALQLAWDGSVFRCHYTGVPLDENDHHAPQYLTFDHRTPRQEQDVVVAAACINDMKSDLTEKEFRAVVIQLAQKFQGGQFDEHVLNLTHWKR